MILRTKGFFPGKKGDVKARVQVLDELDGKTVVLFEDLVSLTIDKSRKAFAARVCERFKDRLNGTRPEDIEHKLIELREAGDQELQETQQTGGPTRLGDYTIIEDAFHFIKQTDEGPVAVPLCNFTAFIDEQRVEDNGAETRRVVTLHASLSSGKSFPAFHISMPDFLTLNGILHTLGTEAIVTPGTLVKDRIRQAIQLYSARRGYPTRQVYTHLGWRHMDGHWVYLHACGALGQTNIDVILDPALEAYRLVSPTIPLKEAVAASLQVLQCAPKRITIPLLAKAYLAPLAEWLKPDFTTWLEGPSGARKSSLAAVVMSHFGTFDRAHPPASWEDSANSLEKLAFLAKDTVLWIDDFAPPSTASSGRELELKAQRVIRAQGNLTGRRRMRSDTSLRPAYYPRGLILATGELHPSGQSTFARLFQLDVAAGDIVVEQLTVAQAQTARLCQAMAGYLRWLEPQLETRPTQWRAYWEQLRAEALSILTNHPRHPEIYAHLGTAWRTFLDFAVGTGALSRGEANEHERLGLEFIRIALSRQRIDAEAEDPVRRFLGIIREAFAQKRVYLNSVDGHTPLQGDQWGWIRPTAEEPLHPAPGAALLGWIDEGFLYLLPDAAYRLAFSSLQQAGTTLIPQIALWKRLVQQGYLLPGNGRYPIRKRVEGRREYVLALAREKLLQSDPPISPRSGHNEDR